MMMMMMMIILQFPAEYIARSSIIFFSSTNLLVSAVGTQCVYCDEDIGLNL
jgi:hypothetical protein